MIDASAHNRFVDPMDHTPEAGTDRKYDPEQDEMRAGQLNDRASELYDRYRPDNTGPHRRVGSEFATDPVEATTAKGETVKFRLALTRNPIGMPYSVQVLREDALAGTRPILTLSDNRPLGQKAVLFDERLGQPVRPGEYDAIEELLSLF
jgi:hypothetical protein